MAKIPGREYYPSGRIKPVGRDHTAEGKRRNDIAYEKGYKRWGGKGNGGFTKVGARNRNRRAVERGDVAPARPKTIRSPKTLAAQEKRLAAVGSGVKPRSASAEDRDMAYDWSSMFAKRIQGEYHPEVAALLGVSRWTYTKMYFAAWVDGPNRYKENRHKGGTSAMFDWFVTLNGFYTAAEYEARYVIR